MLETRNQEFLQKKSMLKDLIKKKQNSRLEREAEVKLKTIVADNIKTYFDLKSREKDSAITIQKWIRGYLVRKNFDLKFSQQVKKYAKTCVDTMQKHIYSMWIDFKYFLKPAKVIEEHYLRYKARKRLLSIQELYIKYCYDKKAERLRIFEYLSYLSIRYKFWELRQPLIIKRRLEAIRKNLSLLKLKYFMQKNNLSPVKIIARLRKFKNLNMFERKINKTASLSKINLPSPYIWRYSMVTLPIEYNENILLGSYSKSNNEKKDKYLNKRSQRVLSKKYNRVKEKKKKT